MTHEFKIIVEAGINAKRNGLKSVLASVVALNGSSYRKPGVRMLVLENDTMIGAVSGGCVEKEILLQSQKVFKTGKAIVMTYDGKYRLGCEGVLYILIELFNPKEDFLKAFFNCLNERNTFEILSYFSKEEGFKRELGSFVNIDDRLFSLNGSITNNIESNLSVFQQKMVPCFKLIVIGAEHDAVQLCAIASQLGWEVTIIAGIKENKTIDNFPNAKEFFAIIPEDLDTSNIDNQTAIVLMNHNFGYDLHYLIALKNTTSNYIGVLGPSKRRDDLLSNLIEYSPEIKEEFLDTIHGPAGLNLGSITPQEIAISIISEILAVTRKKQPISLTEKAGRIHAE